MIIHCPFCQAQFEIEESMFGQPLECGACNQTFCCGKDNHLQLEVEKLQEEKQALLEELETLKVEMASKVKVTQQSIENREDFFSIKGSHFSFYQDGSFLVEMADDSKAEKASDAFVTMLKNGYPEELEVYQNFRKHHELFSGLLGL